MLSINGFKVHLNNIEHYTLLRHAHKEESFSNVVQTSKEVLIRHYEWQQSKIDQYEKTLLKIKESYESKDENKLDELLHSLSTNEVYDDSY